jgi:prepilin-type N-terminal cleavage/methylation domain-containing protein
MTRVRAFTLLEVLLASVLLAVVALSAFSWIGSQGRASRTTQERLEAIAAAIQAVRLLRDDLSLAVAADGGASCQIATPTTLRITTLDRLPGEGPGFHHVVWSWHEDTHQLQRQLTNDGILVAPAPRLVTARLQAVEFVLDEHGQGIARLLPQHDQADAVTLALSGGSR